MNGIETPKNTREHLLGETMDEHFTHSSAPVDELRGVVSVLIQEGHVIGLRGPRRIVDGVKAAFWGLDELDGHMSHLKTLDWLRGVHTGCGHPSPDGQPAAQLPEQRAGAPREGV